MFLVSQIVALLPLLFNKFRRRKKNKITKSTRASIFKIFCIKTSHSTQKKYNSICIESSTHDSSRFILLLLLLLF